MYRKQISQKASPSLGSMTTNQAMVVGEASALRLDRPSVIAPRQAYSPLSSVVQRAQQDPDTVSKDERQKLERAIGTKSTREILAGQDSWRPEFQGISKQLWGNSGELVQAKLTIGAVGDKYEQEADRVAADVVQRINQPEAVTPQQGETIQRQELPEDEELQMKPLVQRREVINGGQASTDLESSINSARSGGQPLDTSLRQSMGQAMGADFSGVKVHTDAQADQLNQSIQAKAFTTGQDVFFRQGAYQPGSQGGQELIAHELTHVVQQRAMGVHRKLVDNISHIGSEFVIQRRNGVTPTNFRVNGAASNNENLTITMNTVWDSNPPGHLDELDDILHREKVVFGQAPGNYVLSYPIWAASQAPRVQLNGNTLTKLAGVMNSGGGTDTHDAAGYGMKFTVNGQPNLKKGQWNLLARQYYQYKQRDQGDDQWRNLHQAPFYIERDMQQNNRGEYELTYRKWGEGIDITAGPTTITFETDQAIAAVGSQRGDQTALWDVARNQITSLCDHNIQTLSTDLRAVGDQNISIRYEYTVPNRSRQADFIPFETLSEQERGTIISIGREAIDKVIAKAIDPGVIPPRFIITVTKLNQVQQQAIVTNENGATYRIILRYGAIWNPEKHPTSMAGREAQRGWIDSTKRKNWIEASVIHEMGHMMHAVQDRNKFLVSTITEDSVLLIANNDPLKAEKMHIAGVNQHIKTAMARKYKDKWTYAKSSPGEVVPEVFTALLKDQNVPKGLAAVYIAYGGKRSSAIDEKLQKIFKGVIPALNNPEDAIPYIDADL
jgi:hypothetical protein